MVVVSRRGAEGALRASTIARKLVIQEVALAYVGSRLHDVSGPARALPETDGASHGRCQTKNRPLLIFTGTELRDGLGALHNCKPPIIVVAAAHLRRCN